MLLILSLGLMVSIYFSFLVFPANSHNHLAIFRSTILVLLAYFFFIGDSLYHWQGIVLFMDGLLSIGIPVLLSSCFLIFLTLLVVLLTTSLAKASFYLILMTNILGFLYLWQSHDWIVTVIAWELFNLSLYLLVSIHCHSYAALSASIKYFLLSALSTSFLLLGVAFFYGLTGSTNYDINSLLFSFEPFNSYLSFPVTFIVLTLLFKLGAAPFYNWSPDLYDSIPTPITVWMTTIVKLSLLLFLIQPCIFLLTSSAHSLFLLSGLLSLIVGSLGLSAQWRIKRFLAYSAISHLGFLLLA